MLPLMFHDFTLLKYNCTRAPLLKTGQLLTGKGLEIHGELCKQSQQKLSVLCGFFVLFCYGNTLPCKIID